MAGRGLSPELISEVGLTLVAARPGQQSLGSCVGHPLSRGFSLLSPLPMPLVSSWARMEGGTTAGCMWQLAIADTEPQQGCSPVCSRGSRETAPPPGAASAGKAKGRSGLCWPRCNGPKTTMALSCPQLGPLPDIPLLPASTGCSLLCSSQEPTGPSRLPILQTDRLSQREGASKRAEVQASGLGGPGVSPLLCKTPHSHAGR